MNALLIIYFILALLASVISFVALYDKNEKNGLYFNEWVSIFFIGLLWPVFALIIAYDVWAKRRLAKAWDSKSNKCGCGCGKESKE